MNAKQWTTNEQRLKTNCVSLQRLSIVRWHRLTCSWRVQAFAQRWCSLNPTDWFSSIATFCYLRWIYTKYIYIPVWQSAVKSTRATNRCVQRWLRLRARNRSCWNSFIKNKLCQKLHDTNAKYNTAYACSWRNHKWLEDELDGRYPTIQIYFLRCLLYACLFKLKFINVLIDQRS